MLRASRAGRLGGATVRPGRHGHMTSLNVVRFLAEEHQGRTPRARLVIIEKAVSETVHCNGTLLRPRTRGWGRLALVGKAECGLAETGAVPHLPGRGVLAKAGAPHESKRITATQGAGLREDCTSDRKQGCSCCHAAAAGADNPVNRVERDVSTGLVHKAIREVLAVAEPLRQGRAGIGSQSKLNVGFNKNGAGRAVWKAAGLVTVDHIRNVDS